MTLMQEGNFFSRIFKRIEYYLPMSIGSFVMFVIILYFFIVVGRMVWSNYNSNKDIAVEAAKVDELQGEVDYLKDQIAYLQTDDFKEKEARGKLAYQAPGEHVIAMPLDKPEDKVENVTVKEADVKVPNPQLWLNYFFGK